MVEYENVWTYCDTIIHSFFCGFFSHPPLPCIGIFCLIIRSLFPLGFCCISSVDIFLVEVMVLVILTTLIVVCTILKSFQHANMLYSENHLHHSFFKHLFLYLLQLFFSKINNKLLNPHFFLNEAVYHKFSKDLGDVVRLFSSQQSKLKRKNFLSHLTAKPFSWKMTRLIT